MLRSVAEDILRRREDERKAKRREEDLRVEERLKQQKAEVEEEERQTRNKERRAARELWKVHGAKWRFRFVCRRGAFTPVPVGKGGPKPMMRKREKRRSAGRKRYEKLKRRRAALRRNSMGGSNAPPWRGVSTSEQMPAKESINTSVPADTEAIPVCVVEDDTIPSGLGSDVIPEAFDIDGPSGIFTRNNGENGAFKQARVEEVLRQVKIGNQLTLEQKLRATALIREYADCFALSVGEVCQIPGATHKLNIPKDATFRKKVHQKPLTPPQKEYMHGKIDELLAAGIIEQCDPGCEVCFADYVGQEST